MSMTRKSLMGIIPHFVFFGVIICELHNLALPAIAQSATYSSASERDTLARCNNQHRARLRKIRQQWHAVRKSSERTLAALPKNTLFDELIASYEMRRLDRYDTDIERMVIELAATADLIKAGSLDVARFYVKQDARLITDLEKQLRTFNVGILYQ